MSSAKEYLQVKFLRTLEPLSMLSVDKLEEIASKSIVQELQSGRVIFRQGEKDSRSTYLLSGQVELQVTGNPRCEVLKAKTADTRYPLAQEWPRPSTCRSKTNVVLLHIDSDLLEILLSTDPSGNYEVTEIGVHEDPESDWMLKFLQSPAFLQLPTENIQSILVKLKEMPVKTGQVIIKQGETDDYYYIVKQGKCSVSRRPAPKMDEIRLAILGPGDGFGEEALITRGKRNATVTAKESGVLMRLSQSDFHEFLVKPMLREVDHTTMMDKVKAGAALIDVRTNREYSNDGVQGAQNIPLSMLRMKSKDLNHTREHITYCNDTTQSRAAAFLLAQQGLNVFVLKDGLSKQTKPFSPATQSEARPTTTGASKSAPVATKIERPAATAPLSAKIPNLGNTASTASIAKPNLTQALNTSKATGSASTSSLKKPDRLQEQSNALLAQADRLAHKTAHAEDVRRKTQAEMDALKQQAMLQRQKILDAAKQEVLKGKEYAKQQGLEASKIRGEAELARSRAEQELARIKAESESVEQKQSELDAELKRVEVEKQQTERAADIARLIAQQEADSVKAEAEAVKQKTLQEAERIRNDLETRKAKMLEQEKLQQKTAIAEARRQAEITSAAAEKTAENARRTAAAEAETIRTQALKEAETVRIQLEQEKQKLAEQAAIARAEAELKRQRMEQEHQDALAATRAKAELEAETIRQKAIAEAQVHAREDAQRKAEVEVQKLRQKAVEQARQEAHAEGLRLATEAEAEARAIRQKTQEQAELVHQQAQQRAEEEAVRRQQVIEEVSRKAMETAQLEADAIRQAAIEEANRLRTEMEQTRQLVENEAVRARVQIQKESAQHQARQDAHTQSVRTAAALAAQENSEQRIAEEQARIAAQIEQNRIAEEQAQLAAQFEQSRIADEQAQLAAKIEQSRISEEQAQIAAQIEQNNIAEEQARIAAKVEQQRQAESLRQDMARHEAQQQSEQRSQKAQQMAKSLRSKLDEHETAVLDDEFQINIGRGPKLSKAKLHVVKDKTILEGEEDIFIFKAPSARPPSREEAETLLQQAEAQLAEQSRNELPSFDLDYVDEELGELVVEQESEFSDSILLELDNITANSTPSTRAQSVEDNEHFGPIKEAVAGNNTGLRSSRSLMALAASVIVMVTISVVAITRPTYLEVEQAATVTEQQPTRGLAAIRARTGNNKLILEDKMKTEAENDFNKMVSKWRDKKN